MPEVFTHIVDEQGLEAYETLFIDDSPQHVAGALKAGLKSYHLKDGEEISQLLP
jgi:putative hydrolase of the HAD superfamily